MARAAETYRAARRNAWIRRDKRDWREGRFKISPRVGVHISLDSKLTAAAHGHRA